MNKRQKCYIASPWFDKEGYGLKEIELIKSILNKFDIDYFSPKDENLVSKNATNEEAKIGFQRNIDEINKCNFMIANVRDKDMGVSIELGYAYSTKLPVILFTPQIKDKPINLMLAQLCNFIAFTEDELVEKLSLYLEGTIKEETKFEEIE